RAETEVSGPSANARAGARAIGLVVLLAVLVTAMPLSTPLFRWAFPALARPLYQRASFAALTLSHVALVAGASLVVIAVGVAIGSTVGALTLGSPIIEGLSGSNTAYVIQGAVLVGLLAIAVDQLFAWLDLRLRRHEPVQA